MRKRANKRTDIDIDFRLDLENQKQGTGVHLNYLGMVTSVLEKHPHVDIKSGTAINWLRRWCEWDIPIPKAYSPKCEHERNPRKNPITKSPNATPVFGVTEPAVASKTESEVVSVTTSETKITSIRIGIDDRYSIIVSNGVQELKISSENGILSISRP
jgi:hypothetical protein